MTPGFSPTISPTLINNVALRVDMPGEIVGASEIKVDGIIINGNITSGVNIGNFDQNVSKIVTFNGKIQSLIAQVSAKQITGIVSSGSISNSDSLTINFQPTVDGVLTPPQSKSSPFMDFVKRWYIWILLAIVLIFLFIVIFRRLSSNI